jgi:hypothetical protein
MSQKRNPHRANLIYAWCNHLHCLLVKGVASDPHALGFFGFAYYLDNKDKLRLLAVDDGDEANGKGPIAPSFATVIEGKYQPLSRPMFIYQCVPAAYSRCCLWSEGPGLPGRS